MKKIAVLLIALVMLVGFALPAFAQEDEAPLTWQEQYWQVYWQVAGALHTGEVEVEPWQMPLVTLWDINNDGILDLVMLRGNLFATIIDGQLQYSTELDFSRFTPTHDFQTDELRLLRRSAGVTDEMIIDWDDLSLVVQNIYRREMHSRRPRILFRYTIHYVAGVPVSSGEFRRLRNAFDDGARFERLTPRDNLTFFHVVRGDIYDEVRENFFTLMDELSNSGSLYVQPIEGLYPATIFIEIEVRDNVWRWFGILADRHSSWLSWLFWLSVCIMGRSRCKRKRQQAPLTAIACVDQNWAIGHENQLLFHIPGDMGRFKHITMGHVLLMGRNTYDSLPKSPSGFPNLPGRKIVVVSRDADFKPRGRHVHVCRTLDEAVVKAKSLGKVFVIGGGQVYDALLPLCNTALITQVDAAAEQADAFFPNLDNYPDWSLTKTEEWRTHNGLKWRPCEYNRQNL
ncbi:MAG: dihydrofolate reductase [Oscillospiraceae bacterium]|nr:dihydrofolate reductase [Oscillospiraceae bacterium]